MVQLAPQPWQHRVRYWVFAVLPLAVACGSSLKRQSVKATPAAPAAARVDTPAARMPIEDPVVTLIAASNSRFEAGQRELQQGHFDAAKVEFDRAVDLLLESPYGARTEP